MRLSNNPYFEISTIKRSMFLELVVQRSIKNGGLGNSQRDAAFVELVYSLFVYIQNGNLNGSNNMDRLKLGPIEWTSEFIQLFF